MIYLPPSQFCHGFCVSPSLSSTKRYTHIIDSGFQMATAFATNFGKKLFNKSHFLLKSFWPCSGKAVAADERADLRLDWQLGMWPPAIIREKSVKLSPLWEISISQKHFCICKERTFRPLDHQEGILLHSDVVQSPEHFNNGALYDEESWSGTIKNPVQHLS